MSSLQDLEQDLTRCWEVTQDLDLLAGVVNDGSDHTETVKGIKNVYDMRFNKAWETYEHLVKEYYAMRNLNSARDVIFDEDSK